MYVNTHCVHEDVEAFVKDEFRRAIAQEIVEKYMRIKETTSYPYDKGIPVKEYSVTFDVFDRNELERLLSQYQATGVY